MLSTNWSSVVERASSDLVFLNRLKSNAESACSELGFELPQGATVQVLEASPTVQHLLLDVRGYSAPIDAMLDRAKEDSVFKAKLLSDPKEIVESAIGEKLPHEFEIHIHECLPNHFFCIVRKAAANDELSEYELEAVAGGGRGILKKIGNFFCPDDRVLVVDFGTNTATGYLDPSIGGLEVSGSTSIY